MYPFCFKRAYEGNLDPKKGNEGLLWVLVWFRVEGFRV